MFLGDTRSAEELAVFTNMAPDGCAGHGLRMEETFTCIYPEECGRLFAASVAPICSAYCDCHSDCPFSEVFGAGKTWAAAAMIGSLLVMTRLSRSWWLLKRMQRHMPLPSTLSLFLLEAAWVAPRRNALQSAEQRC